MLVVMTPDYTHQMSQKLMQRRCVHLHSTVLSGPFTGLTRDDISYRWLLRQCPPKELSQESPVWLGETASIPLWMVELPHLVNWPSFLVIQNPDIPELATPESHKACVSSQPLKLIRRGVCKNLIKIQTTTKILQLNPIFSFPLSPIL